MSKQPKNLMQIFLGRNLQSSWLFFQFQAADEDTTLSGSVASNMDEVIDGCFTYREAFPGVTASDGCFTVNIWTVVSHALLSD
jgi:hypothetical protein